MTAVLIVVIAIVAVLVLFVVATYNGLVRTRNRIDNYSPIAGAKPKTDSGSTGAKKKPWER